MDLAVGYTIMAYVGLPSATLFTVLHRKCRRNISIPMKYQKKIILLVVDTEMI